MLTGAAESVSQVGALERAVEHVVGGEMHEQGTDPFRLLREVAGRGRVDPESKLLLGLGLVDCGIGRGVDDDLRTDFAAALGDGIRVGEIQPVALERDDLAQMCRSARSSSPAHLPCGPVRRIFTRKPRFPSLKRLCA